jgi:hypothetical protein
MTGEAGEGSSEEKRAQSSSVRGILRGGEFRRGMRWRCEDGRCRRRWGMLIFTVRI